MNGRRFRASSWGAGAIILALVLLILHRFGSFLLFFVIGAALLWYGRQQREAGTSGGDAASGRTGAGEAAEQGGEPSSADAEGDPGERARDDQHTR